jgi:hypothetical protein
MNVMYIIYLLFMCPLAKLLDYLSGGSHLNHAKSAQRGG